MGRELVFYCDLGAEHFHHSDVDVVCLTRFHGEADLCLLRHRGVEEASDYPSFFLCIVVLSELLMPLADLHADTLLFATFVVELAIERIELLFFHSCHDGPPALVSG